VKQKQNEILLMRIDSLQKIQYDSIRNSLNKSMEIIQLQEQSLKTENELYNRYTGGNSIPHLENMALDQGDKISFSIGNGGKYPISGTGITLNEFFPVNSESHMTSMDISILHSGTASPFYFQLKSLKRLTM